MDFDESAIEVAVIAAVAAELPAGVSVRAVPDFTPVVAFSVAEDDGLTDMFTVSLNAPVPVTVGVQVAV